LALSLEVRRLDKRWKSGGNTWPKRLDWIGISGFRGWDGQRFDLKFPIMAIVGENGAGKSTLIQAAAAVYKPTRGKGRFASNFFPSTCWEKIEKAQIDYVGRQGDQPISGSLRKPGERWRGNPERPERPVRYIDLSRLQPVAARIGYMKLVKNPSHAERSARHFDAAKLSRMSAIMDRYYELAKLSLTNVHDTLEVPVLGYHGATYSGFHQGAGETTLLDLLESDWPQYSLILIDEIESSLHPRAQRRLIRYIAERCRELETQVVLTTHSPYVLEELPPEARAYIMQVGNRREIVYGVSSAFAMTKMDEVVHPECDLFVEDDRARDLLMEIVITYGDALAKRCRIIPYGSAAVGRALGLMVAERRFPDPSVVYLDGDQGEAPGCIVLPGDESPERVVFTGLHSKGWRPLGERLGRNYPEVASACQSAMLLPEEHDWVKEAANRLILRADILWSVMCSEWARQCMTSEDAKRILNPIEDVLEGFVPVPIPAVRRQHPLPLLPTLPKPKNKAHLASKASLPLFEQSLDADAH